MKWSAWGNGEKDVHIGVIPVTSSPGRVTVVGTVTEARSA